MGGVQIRRAESGDAASIARVQVETWRTAYRGIVADDFLASLSLEEMEAFWSAFLRASGARSCSVAVDGNGAVVGTVSGGPNRGDEPGVRGEVYTLYVLERFQRRGTGARLLRRQLSELDSAGLTPVIVWVLTGNPAERFYERTGAERIARGAIDLGGRRYEEVALRWDDEALRALRGG